MDKNYEPNFKDPRVIKRCRTALSFVIYYVHCRKERFLDQHTLEKYFGSHAHQLSIYLKNTLLKCTDHYYSKNNHQAKKYVKLQSGCDYVLEQLNKNDKVKITAEDIIHESVVLAYSEHKDDLMSLKEGKLEYICKSDRYFHIIQSIPSIIRKPLFCIIGFRYQYDIECCAQTVLYQQAKMIGLKKSLPCIEQYLSDRTAIRNQIANDIGIEPVIVKSIITSLFIGAKLGCNDQWSLTKLLNYNYPLIKQLNSHEYISALKKEISKMWSVLKPLIMIPDSRKRINAVDKSGLYRKLEFKIINHVKQFCYDRGINTFLLHDGLTTDKKLNIQSLYNYININTGFQLKFDYCYNEYKVNDIRFAQS